MPSVSVGSHGLSLAECKDNKTSYVGAGRADRSSTSVQSCPGVRKRRVVQTSHSSIYLCFLSFDCSSWSTNRQTVTASTTQRRDPRE